MHNFYINLSCFSSWAQIFVTSDKMTSFIYKKYFGWFFTITLKHILMLADSFVHSLWFLSDENWTIACIETLFEEPMPKILQKNHQIPRKHCKELNQNWQLYWFLTQKTHFCRHLTRLLRSWLFLGLFAGHNCPLFFPKFLEHQGWYP